MAKAATAEAIRIIQAHDRGPAKPTRRERPASIGSPLPPSTASSPAEGLRGPSW